MVWNKYRSKEGIKQFSGSVLSDTLIVHRMPMFQELTREFWGKYVCNDNKEDFFFFCSIPKCDEQSCVERNISFYTTKTTYSRFLPLCKKVKPQFCDIRRFCQLSEQSV